MGCGSSTNAVHVISPGNEVGEDSSETASSENDPSEEESHENDTSYVEYDYDTLKPGYPKLELSRVEKSSILAENDFKNVDDHARKARPELGWSFEELFAYLTETAETDLMKVRAFYIWICHQKDEPIPSEDLETHRFSPFYFLETSRFYSDQGTDGYAATAKVFKRLCDMAEIPCIAVAGFLRNESYDLNEELVRWKHEHGWNLVFCGNGWRLVDAFLGKRSNKYFLRSEDDERDFTSPLDRISFYFLANPNHLIYTHFPFGEPTYQLLKQPLTLETFQEQMLIMAEFFELGLQLKNNSKFLTTHKRGEVSLQFLLSDNQLVSLKHDVSVCQTDIFSNNIKNVLLNNCVTIQNQKQTVIITFRVPAKGLYKFEIYGRPGSEKDSENEDLPHCFIAMCYLECNTVSTDGGGAPFPSSIPSDYPPFRPPESTKDDIFNKKDSITVDKHSKEAGNNYLFSFGDLVEYLVQGINSDVFKVRVFYAWINDQYSAYRWSSDRTSPGGYSPRGLLSAWISYESKFAVSKLFKMLCDEAKIPCIIVNGSLRTVFFKPGESLDDDEHHWNLVFCGQGWRIVDTYLGCSKSLIFFGENEPRRVHGLDEFYFLADPAQVIHSHFPEDPKYQLLDPPLTLEQFKQQPLLAPAFFEYGIQLKSHSSLLTSHSENEVVLKLELPKNAQVAFKNKLQLRQKNDFVRTANKVELDTCVFNQVQNEVAEFTVRAPVKGCYNLSIYGRQVTEDDNRNSKFDMVASFFLQCNTVFKDTNPPPKAVPNSLKRSLQIPLLATSPLTDLSSVVETDSLGFAVIRFEMDKPKGYLCHLSKVPDGPDLKGNVIQRTVGKVRIVFLKCPEPGEYVLKLLGNSEADRNSYYQEFTCSVEYKPVQKNKSANKVMEPAWPNNSRLGPNSENCEKYGNIRARVDDYFICADEKGHFMIEIDYFRPSTFSYMEFKSKEEEHPIRKLLFMEIRETSATLHGRVPKPGFFMLDIFTHWSDENVARQVLQFLIYARSCQQKPIIFPDFSRELGYEILAPKPYALVLEPNKDTLFSVNFPGATVVVIQRGDDPLESMQKEGPNSWSKTINTGPGFEEIRILEKRPNSGSYYVILEYKVAEPAQWKEMMNEGAILVYDKDEQNLQMINYSK